jgi:hypothetical protein
MGGRSKAPQPPPEQRALLATQERIAREEWAMKGPVLEMFAGWARGQPTPELIDLQKRISEIDREILNLPRAQGLKRPLGVQEKLKELEEEKSSLTRQMYELRATGRAYRMAEIPSAYIPDFERLIAEAKTDYEQRIAKASGLREKLKGRIETAYEPVREAMGKYYGPAYRAASIETIEREATRAKEEAMAARGLPTNIARRLDEIETWRGGSRIETERVANLAMAATMVAFESQLGTERANIEKAMADYEMRSMDELSTYIRAISEQEISFVPSLRLASAQIIAGLPAEQIYANLSNQYMSLYQLQLQRWGMQEEARLGWINAFANIGSSIGHIMTGIGALTA